MSESEPIRVGTVLTLAGSVQAELFAEAFDFIWVDLEHAALSSADAQGMILGAQAAGVAAMVRVRCDALAQMIQVLDAGADGIVLADVPDATIAAAVISHVTHPPAGTRGWGPRRSGTRGRHRRLGARRPQVWAQIERANAVREAHNIAMVTGIDALVVGTADLSLALGVPQQFDSTELIGAVSSVQRAAAECGVEFGVAGPLTTAPLALTKGATILCHSTDARIAAAAADSAAETLRTRAREHSV